MAKITPQNYPRIDVIGNRYIGFLDEEALTPHKYKISKEELIGLISSAIINANRKSSRQILSVPQNASESEASQIYKKEGQKLFSYFKKYVGDPAATAFQLHGKHYKDVGKEHFRLLLKLKYQMSYLNHLVFPVKRLSLLMKLENFMILTVWSNSFVKSNHYGKIYKNKN